MTDMKPELHHVEAALGLSKDIGDDVLVPTNRATGTVQLLVQNETVLIPTPSPDPNDPLNLPAWRKWAITMLMAAYGSTAILLSSGMGAIITDVIKSYPGEEARTSDLLTYPTLFMGIGNLIAMPLALAVGRRPVFIVTMILMVASGIGCTYAPNLSAHIAFRDIMSLAAGQSEALAPMIVQEVHFLHERSRKVAWFAAVECIISAAFFIATTPLVNSGGWRWWYGAFTIINGAILIATFLFGTETMYDRPDDAALGAVHLNFNDKGEVDTAGERHEVIRVTTQYGNVLEPEKYGARTWKKDLRFICVKPRWSILPVFYKEMVQCLCVPSIFWLLLLNGAYLSLYVVSASTFATVLVPPPRNIPFTSLGYFFSGQIVSCLIGLPLLGYGSDWTIKWMSKRNGGIYQPEYRLIALVVPAIVGVVCAVIYGQAAQYPDKYSWGAIAITFNGTFFAFLGANIVGITYAVDSFPLKAGPLLVVICAGRGFISFGLSYSNLPAISALGYDGVMNVESGIAGGLAVLGIAVYFLGPKSRMLGDKWFGLGGQKE